MVVTLGGKSIDYKYWQGCEGRAARLRRFSNSASVRFPAWFHWDRQDHLLEDSLSHVNCSKNFKETPNCPAACPHLLPVQPNTNLGSAVQPKEFQQGGLSGGRAFPLAGHRSQWAQGNPGTAACWYGADHWAFSRRPEGDLYHLVARTMKLHCYSPKEQMTALWYYS